MPGIEDWKIRPYSTIQYIYDEHTNDTHDGFVKKVEDYFSQRIDENSIQSIPSVNDTPLHKLKSGSVVKYRCMVQDVFDPQYYMASCLVTDKNGGATRKECFSYRDIPQLGSNETADFNSSHNATVERQGFYCVPIPGETTWVKEMYSSSCSKHTHSTSTTAKREKRSRENDDDNEEMESDQKITRDASVSGNGVVEDKIMNSGEQHMNGVEAEAMHKAALHNPPSLNMPLPDETGVPCIVRAYSNSVDLKVTDSVEIVGILCMDPRLASAYDETNHNNDMVEKEEVQAHEPPASRVPRLHALVIRKMEHNNPALPPTLAADRYKQASSNLMVDACSLRLELLYVLEHALLGDRLAAEYLLCQLISHVYARVDVLPLGKLGLNLSHCPTFPRYTQFLHHLISQLTTQSVFLDMSIEKMNSLNLVPKKDYAQNRITAGMLQLSSGTSLFVDETALRQGQLEVQGVSNVKALADVIKWQKVEYDYQWHPITMPCDLNVLVLSEGESLLPKDVHLPMTPSGASQELDFDIASHFSKLDGRLTPQNIEKLRSYITVCQLTHYSVDEQTQKIIQDDFVDTRQNNPNNMSVEDFQMLLGLLRLTCLSYGLTSPTIDMWRAAKTMEEERKARISRLPAPANNRPT